MSPDNHADIVSSIIALARGLGMQVVAEGVETQTQADALRTLGCDFGQGYLFSPPLPAREAEPFAAAPTLPMSSVGIEPART